MGGSLFIIMPLVALVRRWCLRELQRQQRPIAPSRITGGCFCPGDSYGACAVIGLSTLAPMPPAPSRLLIPGGACRILFLRLRNGSEGHSLRVMAKVTPAP